MEIIQTFFIFTFSIIVHEYGHYIIPWHWGWKPKIKWGILWSYVEMDESKHNNLPISDALNIRYLGILFGLFTVLIFSSNIHLIIAYMLVCSLDIIQITTYLYYQHILHYKYIYQI